MKFLLDVCAASRSLHMELADAGHDVLSAADGFADASDELLLRQPTTWSVAAEKPHLLEE